MNDRITPNMFKQGLIKNHFECVDSLFDPDVTEPCRRSWFVKIYKHESNAIVLSIVRRTDFFKPIRANGDYSTLFSMITAGKFDHLIVSSDFELTSIFNIFGKPSSILRTTNLTAPSKLIFKPDLLVPIAPLEADSQLTMFISTRTIMNNGKIQDDSHSLKHDIDYYIPTEVMDKQ